MSATRTLRAIPTLLRIGVAETVAYRAEFLVWILTTTLPLVMLGLWRTVAEEAPFRGYSSADFTAYFLVGLIVRNLTGSWVAWQVSEEIRMGAMSMRLLRPLHPFVAYASSHIAAIPFRTIVALPIAIGLLASSGAGVLVTDPVQLVLFVPSIAIAWLITFSFMFAIGCLGFYITKTMAIMNIYFGLFQLLSGYLLPIPLLPGFLRELSEVSPFRFMYSFPVELLTRSFDGGQLAVLMLAQVGWAAACLLGALWLWRAGVRHFEAVGG